MVNMLKIRIADFAALSARTGAVRVKSHLGRSRSAQSRSAPYRLLATQTGIFFAVQLPQNDFIDLVVSSKITVQCDIQTCMPHSEQVATACPLQTEHLANQFTSNQLTVKHTSIATSKHPIRSMETERVLRVVEYVEVFLLINIHPTSAV
jgi:hypothetical protein